MVTRRSPSGTGGFLIALLVLAALGLIARPRCRRPVSHAETDSPSAVPSEERLVHEGS